MKKLIFLFFTFIYFFNANAQNNPYEQQYKNEVVYIPWKQELPTADCQPSFYWSVTRSKLPNAYGQFFYKLYFQSNSRYCNGVWASTYITGINFFVNNQLMNPQGKYWIMFKETYHLSYFAFWANPNPQIGMTWDFITIN